LAEMRRRSPSDAMSFSKLLSSSLSQSLCDVVHIWDCMEENLEFQSNPPVSRRISLMLERKCRRRQSDSTNSHSVLRTSEKSC
jgi:hypothetical protein